MDKLEALGASDRHTRRVARYEVCKSGLCATCTWDLYWQIYDAADEYSGHLLKSLFGEIPSIQWCGSPAKGQTCLSAVYVQLLMGRIMGHENDSVVKHAVSELPSLESYLIRTRSVSVSTIIGGMEKTPSVFQSKQSSDRISGFLARLVVGTAEFQSFAQYVLSDSKPYFPIAYCVLAGLVTASELMISDAKPDTVDVNDIMKRINSFVTTRIWAFPVILRPALVSLTQTLVLDTKRSGFANWTTSQDLELVLSLIGKTGLKDPSVVSHLTKATHEWIMSVFLTETDVRDIDMSTVIGASVVLGGDTAVSAGIVDKFTLCADRTYMPVSVKRRLVQLCIAFPEVVNKHPAIVSAFLNDPSMAIAFSRLDMKNVDVARFIEALPALEDVFSIAHHMMLLSRSGLSFLDHQTALALRNFLVAFPYPRLPPDYLSPSIDVGDMLSMRTREEVQDTVVVLKWTLLSQLTLNYPSIGDLWSHEYLMDELQVSGGSRSLVALNKFVKVLLEKERVHNRDEFLRKYVSEFAFGELTDRESDSNNMELIQSVLDVAFFPCSAVLADRTALMTKILSLSTPHIGRAGFESFLAFLRRLGWVDEDMRASLVPILAALVTHKEPFDESGIEGSVFGLVTATSEESEIEATSAFIRVVTLVYIKETANKELIAQLVKVLLDLIKKYQSAIIERKAPQTPLPFTPFHQIQLRVYQSLCYLAPLIDESTFVSLIEPDLFGPLLQWANQPDARDYLETLAIYFLVKFKFPLGRLISTLRDYSLSSQAVASFVVIGGYLASSQIEQFTPHEAKQLVHALLPFLSSNIAYIRGVSQMWLHAADETGTLRSLFNERESESYSFISTMLNFIKTNKESVQMRSKLKPVYALWDPMAAIESGEILSLCSSRGAMFRNSELVPSIVFIDAVRAAVHEALQDNWFYSRDLQSLLEDGLAGLSGRRTGEPVSVEGTEMNSGTNKGVNSQKKYVPPVADMFPGLEQQDTKTRRQVTELIVVTSLVEKVTNIAGLCRTAEVFGAKKLVVPSMHVVKDPQFSSMSVTAEQWIDIEEVPEKGITEYLGRIKQEGYTVVCLEQTHDSVEITEYAFPNKTCLVLGNEKCGVPVQYLPLMDVCVEIPQRGVIRSLNVHVSGAIAMWQYMGSLSSS